MSCFLGLSANCWFLGRWYLSAEILQQKLILNKVELLANFVVFQQSLA